MKARHCSALALAIALGAGSAVAQAPYGGGPFGWGPGAGGPTGSTWGMMRLDVDTSMERDVFVVVIRYAGIAPEDLKVAQQGRDLRIFVERSTQQEGPGGRVFGSSRMSRDVSLPADADPSRMQRQDGPGFATLLFPRRMPGPRW